MRAFLRINKTRRVLNEEDNKCLIDNFINAIYLYDDKITFTFNYKDETKTVLLSECNSSSASSDTYCFGPVKESKKYLSGEIRSGEADSNVLFRREEIEHIFSSCEMITALTEREKEVLRCILANKRRKEIAEELFVTESTIKKYTASVFRKLSVANRIELFAKLRNYV